MGVIKNRLLPFLYDPSTNVLHIAESRCTNSSKHLVGTTLKKSRNKNYRVCPTCCTATWKQALRNYNREYLQKLQGSYFHIEGSGVFHRNSCNTLLNSSKPISESMYFTTMTEKGFEPCKICKPVEGIISSAAVQNGSWMSKEERVAYTRYRSALTEREQVSNQEMLPSERDDVFVRTSTNFAFFASKGYSNFHLRSCPKSCKLQNLVGFVTYKEAISKGYSPCRECKPSARHDVKMSIPLKTKAINDEKISDVISLCDNTDISSSLHEPYLQIKTFAADWKVKTIGKPIIMYHKPNGQNSYHLQHRMFMSLTDAVKYIIKHDNVRKAAR